jgi:hypothetical protein
MGPFDSHRWWRRIALPILFVLGALSIAYFLVEGPALPPFLYGVF